MGDSQQCPMDTTTEILSSVPELMTFLLIKKDRGMEAMQLGLRQIRTLICFSYCMLIIRILSTFDNDQSALLMSIQWLAISAGTVSQHTFLFYKNANK